MIVSRSRHLVILAMARARQLVLSEGVDPASIGSIELFEVAAKRYAVGDLPEWAFLMTVRELRTQHPTLRDPTL